MIFMPQSCSSYVSRLSQTLIGAVTRPISYISFVPAGHTDIQAYVTPCASSNCPSAHQQVANVFGTLRQRKLTLSKVWVDVGGAEWPCDVTKNRKFIWALARSIAAYGTPVGIRTSAGRWLTVVGEWSDLSAYYPLWYTLLDGGQQVRSR